MQEHERQHGKCLYASYAQLTVQHTKEDLNGKTLVAVANFPRKQIGPRMSDCLITGVQTGSSDAATRSSSTVLVQCSHSVQPGLLITLTGRSCWFASYTQNMHATCCLPSAATKQQIQHDLCSNFAKTQMSAPHILHV